MIRRLLRYFAGLSFFVVAGLSAWIAYFVYGSLAFPETVRDFDIEDGITLRATARKLQASGIISDARRFEWLARALGKGTAVKAGSYQVASEWSALQLLEAITGTATKLDRIALLEGWTVRQVRRALDEHDALRHDTRGRSDAEIVSLMQVGEPNLEGLLFPDTYHFAKGSSDLAVLRRASARMRRVLQEQWATRAPDSVLKTPYEALIVASIIEKETGRGSDRGLIAGVLVNRLRVGMRLQADPTVIYGLGDDFDGNLRRRDLETDGPYNTYVRNGLPPTPIAMPSAASIAAAVRPDPTKALYFVARGDGSSHFSETLAEHNRAVTKYQRQQTTVR